MKNKNINNIWKILFCVSALGIVLSFITAYILSPTHHSTRENFRWEEMIIWPLYFTIMSNMMALVASSLVIFRKIDTQNIKLLRFKILMSVCLTVTLIVYWSILAPESIGSQNWFQVIQNVFVHALTPVLAVAAFTYERYQSKTVKISYRQINLMLILFPAAWIIMASIVYFAFGAGPEDAIYSFLRYKQNSTLSSFIYIFGIAVAFILFTSLYTLINNKVGRKNQ